MYTDLYMPASDVTWFQPRGNVVLVVEDDEAILDSICTVLRDEGFFVREAKNGLEALAQLANGQPKPDLILLDMVMPLMGGADFLGALEKEADFKDVPVAMLSAGKIELHSPLTVATLAKPLDIDDLLNLVHRYADAPAGSRPEIARC